MGTDVGCRHCGGMIGRVKIFVLDIVCVADSLGDDRLVGYAQIPIVEAKRVPSHDPTVRPIRETGPVVSLGISVGVEVGRLDLCFALRVQRMRLVSRNIPHARNNRDPALRGQLILGGDQTASDGCVVRRSLGPDLFPIVGDSQVLESERVHLSSFVDEVMLATRCTPDPNPTRLLQQTRWLR